MNKITDHFTYDVNFPFLPASDIGDNKIRDWSQTSMGPSINWPNTFATSFRNILHSPFPIFLFWGADFIFFYNESSQCFDVNNNFNQQLGNECINCSADIFQKIKPFIKEVLHNGKGLLKATIELSTLQNNLVQNLNYLCCFSTILNDKGKAEGVIINFAQKADRNKTLLKNKIYQTKAALFEASEVGTWDIDIASNKTTINQPIKKIFGLNNDIVDLKDLIDCIHLNDREMVNAAIEKCLQFSSGGELLVDFKIINPKSLEEYFIRSKGKVLFSEEHPVHFSGIALDITLETINQQALIDSEHNFRQLVAQTPVAICVLKGTDFKVHIINHAMLEIVEKTEKEILGKPIFSSFPNINKQQFEDLLLGVYNTGIQYVANENELNYYKDGVQITGYYNFVYEALKDDTGNIEGVMVIATNVSEQVNARQKIEEAEERTRLAVDGADLGTYDFNIITNKVISSPRARVIIFGIEDTASRDMFAAAIHPDDAGIRVDAYEKAFISGSLSYRIRVIWLDETIHWVRVEGKLFFDKENKPIRVIGTVLDITDQQQTEKELLKINQRFAIAMEVGKLGSYELDLNTGEIEASEQFRTNYGFNQIEIITMEAVISKIIPAQRDDIRQAITTAIENKTESNIEYQIQLPDKSLRWIKSSAKALYTKHRVAHCVIGITADITDTKQLQKQKDDFIGMVSHELKSPLTSIKGYNEILSEILTEKGLMAEAGLLSKMKIQVNRVTNMIEDLQENTKTNSGNLRLKLVSFDLNKLLKSVVEDLININPGYKIEQQYETIPVIKSDKDRLVQVVNNLLSNAIKYGVNNKKIIVCTVQTGSEIILSVRDFGAGIEKDNLPKVFEQFYRILDPKFNNVPGLGLGLYISAEIIKQLGGKIWVESEPGKGSIFYIALPV